MSRVGTSKKVYYYVLEGNCYAFADERTRMLLLELIGEVQKDAGWQIYAFCITNEALHFVAEAKSLAQIERDFQYIVKLFHGRCRKRLPGWWSEAVSISAGRGRCLKTDQEITESCCLIHRLPLEYEYVKHLGDYWWSSYITYAGIYEWQLVDCSFLMQYFSGEPSKARRALKKFHRDTWNASDKDNEEETEI